MPKAAKKTVTATPKAAPVAAKPTAPKAVSTPPAPPSKVPRAQLDKAVKALVAFNEKKTAASKLAPATGGKKKGASLLDNDDDDDLEDDPSNGKNFWLVVSTKKMPSSLKIKPAKICRSLLIYKGSSKEYKELLESKGIKISKVIGVSKLKADYYSYEAKRKLCDSYHLFLTDDRIVAMLPPLLGKAFFAKKKHPIPISLKSRVLEKEIQKARSGTFLHLNKGLCNSVKIGTTAQTPSQVVDNIEHSLEIIISKIPGKWENVQSIHLKLSDSVALPLYNSLPEADLEIEVAKPKVDKKAKDDDKKKTEVKLRFRKLLWQRRRLSPRRLPLSLLPQRRKKLRILSKL
ncbi:ribosomal protein L1 [Rhizoclosmatium globosum]|uniref:Ribosomal L1 domain-containing protein 1 n=1 Tax=Rhizoclosmatium globosum TaxID=329046 RepID=A0A1Y2D1F1_9FUNG|nr:ribosomal protein L1 [Rhizoclosmatium globosum]|eukprot:ORY53080.1 ribosomal protein L1 [Rhizoclosmatium globosum]